MEGWKKESSNKEVLKKEGSKKESSKKEGSKKEGSKKETFKKDCSRKEGRLEEGRLELCEPACPLHESHPYYRSSLLVHPGATFWHCFVIWLGAMESWPRDILRCSTDNIH